MLQMNIQIKLFIVAFLVVPPVGILLNLRSHNRAVATLPAC